MRIFFLFCVGLLAACGQQGPEQAQAPKHTPRLVAANTNEQDLERRVRLVREYVIAGNDSVHYHMIVNGETIHEQSYRTVIENLGNENYRYTEFSGSFAEPGTNTVTYSGVDFELHAADTASQVDSLIRAIREYKVILSATTTEVRQSGENSYALDAIRSLKAGGRTYQVYRLIGLDSPVAAYTNHYKTGLELPAADNRYWVPEFGTILTWFGSGTSYEMVRTAIPAEEKVLKELREAIRKTWKVAD